jgi:hypothetical protein
MTIDLAKAEWWMRQVAQQDPPSDTSEAHRLVVQELDRLREAVPEVQCPNCEATIRARMADQGEVDWPARFRVAADAADGSSASWVADDLRALADRLADPLTPSHAVEAIGRALVEGGAEE